MKLLTFDSQHLDVDWISFKIQGLTDPKTIASNLSKYFNPNILMDDLPSIGFHGFTTPRTPGGPYGPPAPGHPPVTVGVFCFKVCVKKPTYFVFKILEFSLDISIFSILLSKINIKNINYEFLFNVFNFI